MKKESFKKRYRDLETEVIVSLRDKVEKSHYDYVSINNVNYLNHKIVLIDDRLQLCDLYENYSSIYQINLEILIDILEG